MQILTPQQTEWLKTIGWDIIRSGIVGACAIAVHRLHKTIAAIRPGIVKDVSTAVMPKVQAALDSHTGDDQRQFEMVKDLIRETSSAHSQEIHAAIDKHIAGYHRTAPGD